MVSLDSLKSQSVVIDSEKSRVFRLRKGVMTTARLVNDRLRAEKIRWVPLMVTLTYEDVNGWDSLNIAKFIDAVRKWASRKGYVLPYVWVMELQKRGAPHYHVLMWLPARLRLPSPDKRGWWSHGSSNVQRVKNAVGYVAKYASKFDSKGMDYPKGSRIHGIGGISQIEKRIVSWWKLPKDLREGEEGSCKWVRRQGGGWKNPDTGEVRGGEWGLSAVDSEHKTVRLVRKCEKYHEKPQYYGVIESYNDQMWRDCLNLRQWWQDLQSVDSICQRARFLDLIGGGGFSRLAIPL